MREGDLKGKIHIWSGKRREKGKPYRSQRMKITGIQGNLRVCLAVKCIRTFFSRDAPWRRRKSLITTHPLRKPSKEGREAKEKRQRSPGELTYKR